LRLWNVARKAQKSLVVGDPKNLKMLEKRRVKRSCGAFYGEDFCGCLMGPPAARAKSKSQNSLVKAKQRQKIN
jgi:hypothetical protein